MSNQTTDDQEVVDETNDNDNTINDDNTTATDVTEEVTDTAVEASDSVETTEETDATEGADVDETHRAAVSDAVAQAQGQGLDLGQLSQQLGLSTEDVNAMTHGDLMSVATHLAKEHPEIAQNLLGRVPVIGGLLGNLFGGSR
jgi:hypothetical protein